MRKLAVSIGPVLAVALAVAAFWPTSHADVEQFGDNVYETIWFWRIPAYASNPAWRVQWRWSDPLRAQARCCRATSQSGPGPARDWRIPPGTNQPIARLEAT
jgi:hypothetical protein